MKHCMIHPTEYYEDTCPQCQPVSEPSLLGSCGTCKYWQPASTIVPGCGRQMQCGASRMMTFGMYGQDGRAVITSADFGCIHHRPNTEIADKGSEEAR
jgi:hypothetical protein